MNHYTHLALRVVRNCRNEAHLIEAERYLKYFKMINYAYPEDITTVSEALRERKHEIEIATRLIN